MSIVRVKKDVAVVVFDVPGEQAVSLAPDMPFEHDAPVVRLHPEFFTSDATESTGKRTTSVPVEQATAEPGSKRNR
jgi:hypothetical protein